MKGTNYITAAVAVLAVAMMLVMPCAFAVNTPSATDVKNTSNGAVVDQVSVKLFNDSECQQEVDGASAFQGFCIGFDVKVNSSDPDSFTYAFNNTPNGQLERTSKILYLKSTVDGDVSFNYSIFKAEGKTSGTPVVTVTSIVPEVRTIDDSPVSVSSSTPNGSGTVESTFHANAGDVYKIIMAGKWNNGAKETDEIKCTGKQYLTRILEDHWVPGFDCSFDLEPDDSVYTKNTSVSNSSNEFTFKTKVDLAVEIVQPEGPGGEVSGSTTTVGGETYSTAVITCEGSDTSAVTRVETDYDITISGDSAFIISLDVSGPWALISSSNTVVEITIPGYETFSMSVAQNRSETAYVALNADGTAIQKYAQNDTQFAIAKNRAFDGDGSSITMNVHGQAGTNYLGTQGKVVMKVILIPTYIEE